MSDDCPNCGAAIKSGLIGNNALLSDPKTSLINLTLQEPIDGFCQKCGPDLFASARSNIGRQVEELKVQLEVSLGHVPLCSTHSPMAWQYDTLELVTAQSVTGTGLFSDVTSAFTDLFGTQSGAYNIKIRAGEDLCRNAIRAQTLELGGNAILAVDVDYAEVGGQRAMLMVCMTGTAVKLKNPDVVSQDFSQAMAKYPEQLLEYRSLQAAVHAARDQTY